MMKAPENSYTKCKLYCGVLSLPLKIFIQLSLLIYLNHNTNKEEEPQIRI